MKPSRTHRTALVWLGHGYETIKNSSNEIIKDSSNETLNTTVNESINETVKASINETTITATLVHVSIVQASVCGTGQCSPLTLRMDVQSILYKLEQVCLTGVSSFSLLRRKLLAFVLFCIDVSAPCVCCFCLQFLLQLPPRGHIATPPKSRQNWNNCPLGDTSTVP